jgi:hypothetical protein
MDKLRSVLSRSDSSGDTLPITEIAGGENSSMCPSMKFKDRMLAFGVMTGVGIMLSIAGTINIFFGNLAGKSKAVFIDKKSFGFRREFYIEEIARNRHIRHR